MSDETELFAPLLELYSPEELDEWIHSPHPELGMITPCQAVLAGNRGTVKAVIARLVDGAWL
jgi:hypothetical protein